MDDFGMFARDLGYRPSGKAAPMKSTSGSDAADPSRNRSSPFSGDDQNRDGLLFNDVFGGPPKYSSSTNNSSKTSGMSDFDYDSIFKNSAGGANEPKSKSTYSSSTLPVYDKPVYDDDIFDGLPGMKSKSMSSSSAKYEDNVFASMVSPPKRSQQSDHFDDLLGNLGKTEKIERKSSINSKSHTVFDDLLPGFGSGSTAASNRSTSEPSQIPRHSSITKEASANIMRDPFVVLESTSTPGVSSTGLSTDPLEKLSKSGSVKAGGSSPSGGVFDDIDPLNDFSKSVPGFSNENNRAKDRSPLKEGSSTGRMQNSTNREPFEKTSSRFSDTHSQKKVPVDDFMQSHQSPFGMPSVSRDPQRSFDQTASSPFYANYNGTTSQVDTSPRSEEYVQPSDDIWLSVAEIPLFTQPTMAPPPSRPPPAIPKHTSRPERGSFASDSRRKGSDFSSSPNSVQYSQSPRPFKPRVESPVFSPADDLENFAMGRMHNKVEEPVDILDEEMDSNSAAAAMKDAMDRAEAKFRHAKEVREREHAKAARNKETTQLERDEETIEENQDREMRETQERLEQERRQRENEEEERERRRLEKERSMEIEREKAARQAVERATREARERAATEARERAAAEARLKAERAAVQRAQAEARERAAVGARERAERAAVEARERAAAEAREKEAAEAREKEARDKAAVARAEADARRRAERAAVDRVAAAARERAAAEARERAAAAARMNQQKNDNDLESFFSMNSRPSSAPRPRANSSGPASDPQSQSRGGPEGPKKTSSSGVSSNMRKASSTTNIVDDLSSIFGEAAAPAGGFQDVEGETDERRRARLERHQRTQDRAAKALAEKNQRDLQALKDQEERHRMADTLDSEIKRWSAGKEGNLRALLSTLQYVLWPECGWQPVSLTDLITGASVKKVYRKATLCIHPDKVQQKGANLQQKYVAEKVFDLLKEAWNKFNSEELF